MQNDFLLKDKSLAAVSKLDNALAFVMTYGNYADSALFFRAELDHGVDLLVFKERERQRVVDDTSRDKRLYFALKVEFKESKLIFCGTQRLSGVFLALGMTFLFFVKMLVLCG